MTIKNRGEQNGRAKLTEARALLVLDLLGQGKTQTEVAALIGVTSGQVSHIATGRRWKHLASARAIQGSMGWRCSDEDVPAEDVPAERLG